MAIANLVRQLRDARITARLIPAVPVAQLGWSATRGPQWPRSSVQLSRLCKWTEDTLRATVQVADLKLPAKQATVRGVWVMQEVIVIDGEAGVLVPARA